MHRNRYLFSVSLTWLLMTAAACHAQPQPPESHDPHGAQPLRAAIEDWMACFRIARPRAASTSLGSSGWFPPWKRLPGKKPPGWRRSSSLRREALVANPLVSGQPLLFVVRRQYRPDHHNTETMFQTGEINTGSFQGGGALKTIDLATRRR